MHAHFSVCLLTPRTLHWSNLNLSLSACLWRKAACVCCTERKIAMTSLSFSETQSFCRGLHMNSCLLMHNMNTHTHMHSHTGSLLLLSGTKPNSQSAFCSSSQLGSGNLFLLWELWPVHRQECAYMVGKSLTREGGDGDRCARHTKARERAKERNGKDRR